jgi:hypothetical protein
VGDPVIFPKTPENTIFCARSFLMTLELVLELKVKGLRLRFLKHNNIKISKIWRFFEKY